MGSEMCIRDSVQTAPTPDATHSSGTTVSFDATSPAQDEVGSGQERGKPGDEGPKNKEQEKEEGKKQEGALDGQAHKALQRLYSPPAGAASATATSTREEVEVTSGPRDAGSREGNEVRGIARCGRCGRRFLGYACVPKSRPSCFRLLCVGVKSYLLPDPNLQYWSDLFQLVA